jgi:general secretion pathway protein E
VTRTRGVGGDTRRFEMVMATTTNESFTDRLARLGLVGNGTAEPTPESGGLRALMERTTLEPSAFADHVAAHFGLPRVSLEAMQAGRPLTSGLSRPFLRDHAVYPWETATGDARLAIADPSDVASLRVLELTLGRAVTREVASFEEIDSVLRAADGDAAEAEAIDGLAEAVTTRDTDDLDDLRDMASGAPVVRAVNELFERAAEARATDIHVEPFRNTLQVRLRIDGLLRPIPAPPAAMARAIVSRIKILAGLNIAERRLPQDGRARIRVGSAEIDLRIATMPTAAGEAAIIRLLERNPRLVNLTRLGLGDRDRAVVEHHIEAPHGMIVVTGPTGSGKTTTIAAILAHLNRPLRKILTIEDPIEYEIPGVNQSQVKPAIGLTFATALRAFLRQDPDVIMVGEMRDGETARIGVQASLTGHLVVTTLHTNTAAAAVMRLADMGVEPYLLASTLRMIIGQRLVRLLCPECRTSEAIDAATIAREPRYAAIGLAVGDRVGRPVGCPHCAGSGYRGRVAVFEVLEVSEPIRRMITRGLGDGEVEAQAESEGMSTMIADGLAKCRAGLTSVDEILRVTASR